MQECMKILNHLDANFEARPLLKKETCSNILVSIQFLMLLIERPTNVFYVEVHLLKNII